MQRTAPKNKKGFTLIELLVVLAIVMVTMTALGAGALYLQNAMSLDNTVRQMKSEVQATQNLARNSFFSGFSSASTSKLTDRRISVGWILTIESKASQKIVESTKRSVYVIIPNSATVQYDFSNLRSDIVKLQKSLQGKSFTCHATSNKLTFSSNAAVEGSPVTFSAGTTSTPVMCTEKPSAGQSSTEYIGPTTIGSAVLSDQGSLPAGVATPMCFQGNTQVDLFFTSGYGETAVMRNADCQIRVQSRNNFASSSRAIKFNVTSGGATTCGSYCQ